MTSNILQCHLCKVVLADNERAVKNHISSIHLSYRPYECRTCNENCHLFKTATEEDMDTHIAVLHGAINSGHLAIKDQIKEAELKAAIKKCRREWILQKSGNAVKAEIDFIKIDDDDETSIEVALESARQEVEQSHNSPAIDQTTPESVQDLADRPALTDFQATVLPAFDQPSGINEEPIENQEVYPNIDFSRFTSKNLYPTISSNIMENKCDINRTDHFHGTIEEVHDSNVTYTNLTTDQVSNNGSTTALEQVQFAVYSSAIGYIKAPVTFASGTGTMAIGIPPLPPSNAQNKQFRSSASKCRTGKSHFVAPPKEPLQKEGSPLKSRLRGQKHPLYFDSVFSDSDDSQESSVQRKRGRRSRTEQSLPRIQRSKSVPTFVKAGQNLQHYGFEESESEIGRETLTNKARQNLKAEDCQSESGHEALAYRKSLNDRVLNNKQKQLHECEICSYSSTTRGQLAIHMRFHDRKTIYDCDYCPYISDSTKHLKRHMYQHTGEKPFKCEQCTYAAIQKAHLKNHMRARHAYNI